MAFRNLDGGRPGGMERHCGGRLATGNRPGFRQAMVDHHGLQPKLVQVYIQVLMPHQVKQPVEGVVVRDQGQFAQFMRQRDITAREIGGIIGLGRIAREQRGDGQGGRQ